MTEKKQDMPCLYVQITETYDNETRAGKPVCVRCKEPHFQDSPTSAAPKDEPSGTATSSELFQALGMSKTEAEKEERGINAVIRRQMIMDGEFEPAPKDDGDIRRAIEWAIGRAAIALKTAEKLEHPDLKNGWWDEFRHYETLIQAAARADKPTLAAADLSKVQELFKLLDKVIQKSEKYHEALGGLCTDGEDSEAVVKSWSESREVALVFVINWLHENRAAFLPAPQDGGG